MKKIFLLFPALLMAATLLSCQQSNQVSTQKNQTETTSSDNPYLKAQVKNLLSQYYILKDALVETDATKSQAAASELLQVIESTDASQIEGADKATYNTHAKQLQAATAQIAAATDVEVQRASFEQVTADMLALVKAFKPADAAIYYQYCPMAFDFKGAHWLSNEEEIMNPYFGDKMLHCGKVEEEI